MSLNELDDDRTVGEYLEDIEKMELSGRYPRHSGLRSRTLAYWEDALRRREVDLDDPLPYALAKVKKKEELPLLA